MPFNKGLKLNMHYSLTCSLHKNVVDIMKSLTISTVICSISILFQILIFFSFLSFLE